MNELAPIEAYCAGLIASLEPPARRALASEMARRLRESNVRRIAAQQNPDGSLYAPRKTTLRAKKGALRRGMFTKLRTARFLKAKGSPDSAVVAFAADVQRIALVHHHGLRDRVNRRGGPEVDYPARELLGVADGDLQLVQELVLAHLSR